MTFTNRIPCDGCGVLSQSLVEIQLIEKRLSLTRHSRPHSTNDACHRIKQLRIRRESRCNLVKL